ncbi:2-succinyl-6-hydroxy-2,4-cyclohexadiene-1-carboxylate synthase [Superficieibacter electus]|uniref:2-succinyl-6-hydroxy-2,4-cyclohexadiene-1-carboxylate synthase n=1 Tax=Superficieibacter electus TaxID=2022662 RepID=A0A2P5GWH0_9ENTR|nr:2-succinyl-6-hydroxy-2,4-cyclohexadiene-1-carboxylate synthase [Superficieibacter electus]POP47879.1 2-succinyl-6-hydroxy-2,4-cyclohexadiene-1-carboxylate synthase [Superficieibacter electus]POP50892.1 2-succinyl-6-hydroxy-2,4-cyclohexadiene-1-carboxylate synthase [Superficieibacter electus]
MRLHAIAERASAVKPWLIFLHGFSGDHREWRDVGEQFPHYSRLYVDLPGHGGSAGVQADGFAGVDAALTATLLSYNILEYWLVGYSLGGRIAMYRACQGQRSGLQGVIVEGGHPGLQDDAARKARWLSDQRWAEDFRHQPLSEVFTRWYQQPVFASLTDAQRRELVLLRQKNNGPALADMLLATSLAVQPDLRPVLSTRDFPFWYLCGERDAKFRAIANEFNAPCHCISAAGHNAHREAPASVAAALAQILPL